MPSFAELRAKAEAAASSAKETANSKIADYRGDKKQEKPVYKVPPRRPAVKPPLPPDTSRPRVAGYDVEETVPEEVEVEEPVHVENRKPVGRTALRALAVQGASREDQGKGIETLLKNKDLFFQFLDDVCIIFGFLSIYLINATVLCCKRIRCPFPSTGITRSGRGNGGT
jgi:hypothetical protein